MNYAFQGAREQRDALHLRRSAGGPLHILTRELNAVQGLVERSSSLRLGMVTGKGDECRSTITRPSSTHSIPIGKRGDELALGSCGNFRFSEFHCPPQRFVR